MSTPVKIAVTGAAGQIGYSLLFRIASGHLLGPDQPLMLQLLEITPALGSLQGVAMELEDCAFPLLQGVVQTDDANKAFEGVNVALLVGSRPRSKGMERKDLLEANGAIFTTQGKALAASAADDVKVLVVGNPANTNCLIAMNNAKGIAPERFTAMTRLDHNRAVAKLAAKAGVPVTDIRKMTIWGNHSATQYPDVFHAGIAASRPRPGHRRPGLAREPLPAQVQKRGAAIIEARGASSAASAANATIDHMHNWLSARPRTTGSPWPSPPTARTASPRGSFSRSPAPPRTARTPSCRGSTSTSTPRATSTRRSPSSARSATRCAPSAWSPDVGGDGARSREHRPHAVSPADPQPPTRSCAMMSAMSESNEPKSNEPGGQSNPYEQPASSETKPTPSDRPDADQGQYGQATGYGQPDANPYGTAARHQPVRTAARHRYGQQPDANQYGQQPDTTRTASRAALRAARRGTASPRTALATVSPPTPRRTVSRAATSRAPSTARAGSTTRPAEPRPTASRPPTGSPPPTASRARTASRPPTAPRTRAATAWRRSSTRAG